MGDGIFTDLDSTVNENIINESILCDLQRLILPDQRRFESEKSDLEMKLLTRGLTVIISRTYLTGYFLNGVLFINDY